MGYGKEGYMRSCLSSDCRLHRTPVDYAFKAPQYIKGDLHYEGNPHDKLSALEIAPVDLFLYQRQLAEKDGVLFQQYTNEYKGCGSGPAYVPNDTKGRYDLRQSGEEGLRRAYDDSWNAQIYGAGTPVATEYDPSLNDPFPSTHRQYWDGLIKGRLSLPERV